MNKTNEFKSFVEKELSGTLQTLHLELKNLLKEERSAPFTNPKLRKLQFKILLFSIPIVWILFKTIPLLIFFYVIIIYFFIHIGGRMGVSVLGAYRLKYKKTVIYKILQFFGYEFEYTPFGNIPLDTINQSLIFPLKGNSLHGDDLVKAKVGETQVQFCEIFVKLAKIGKTTHLLASKQQQKENEERMILEMDRLMFEGGNPFFKGLFFMADFNKDFQCYTVVRPRKFEWGEPHKRKTDEHYSMPAYRSHGRLQVEETGEKLETVRLEDPEFAGYFDVFSNDQVLSRYILTPSMMEKIKALRQKSGNEVFISFSHSTMYIAVPLQRPMLEAKGSIKQAYSEYIKPGAETKAVMMAEKADNQHILDFFEDLTFAFDIVEDLQLNTRIWTRNQPNTLN
jgi:hypothetical protein